MSTPQEQQAPEELHCHWCDVPLADGGRCPKCRRRQVKVCYCGEELQVDQAVCPNCRADWAGVVKVVRRRRRRAASGTGLLQAAALGILIALLLTALASSVISRLALGSAETSALPEAPAERLGLAWKTVADTFSQMGEAFLSRVGGVALILLLGLVGALIGVYLYLRRQGAFLARRHDGPPDSHPARRRRLH